MRVITTSWQILTVVSVEFELSAQELLIGAVMQSDSVKYYIYAEFLQASSEGQHKAEITATNLLVVGDHHVTSTG